MITVSFTKSFLRTGIPFGIFMGLLWSLIYGVQRGLISGLLTGTLFGLAMAGFLRYQSRKTAANPPTLTDETVMEEGPANHFLNGEGVGGWLYLTDKRLRFSSHSLNFQTHSLSIDLRDIETLTKRKSLGLISNQLVIGSNGGGTERFVVNDPDRWMTEIDLQLRLMRRPQTDA